ncbi:hypothetical protein PR048_021941 [Dryococelus australis]|uniref:MADF domain-containing protein n=1 Tax=Dryococelus australis TaxID=614101 RepID=A0ABQ9GZL2_9NEOP|nr:hypothetical protein PR048_021941 [Dryococelus australis]
MAESTEVEMLIEHVKMYSETWDVKCKLYHDKNTKSASWMKILSAWDSGFEEKTQKEIEEFGKNALLSMRLNVVRDIV